MGPPVHKGAFLLFPGVLYDNHSIKQPDQYYFDIYKAKYQKTVRDLLNDSLPLWYSTLDAAEVLLIFIVYRICHLKCPVNTIVFKL